MKVALYISGKVRTLFYKFHKNIELLRDRYPNCEIDVFYSFWDSIDRSDKINDAWHFTAENYQMPVINEGTVNSYFNLHHVKSIGEIESSDKMNEVILDFPPIEKV